MNILIKDAEVLTPEYTTNKANIYITDDLIVGVGEEPADFVADRVINANNHMAVPGFVNAHTHASMTLFRSYADDMMLMDWLNQKIWPAEAKMKLKDIRIGAELALLEMIKTGTTCFADMYGPYDEEIVDVMIKSGIRGVISRGAISFISNVDDLIKNNVDLFDNFQGAGDGRISIFMGLHAPYTCSPELCKKVAEKAKLKGMGIHIHMSETKVEVDQMLEKYGKRPFKYIEDTGVFESPTIAAHCIWLDDDDIAIMKKHNITAVHNPGSNLKLASGIAPVERLIKEGINVALGTDGASSNNNLDMLEETRLAAIVNKIKDYDPLAIPASSALKLATENGAKGLMLKNIGIIKTGYKADIALYDMSRPEWCPRHNLVSLLVYSANSASIDTLLCNGKVVMEKGEVLTLDEERILYEANKAAMDLVGRV